MSQPTDTPAARHRRKMILIMEAVAIFVCVALLFVGVVVARGLESSLLEWIVKFTALGLLAGLWVAIPRLYDSQLRDFHPTGDE